jgi:2-haloacid dehalogenase
VDFWQVTTDSLDFTLEALGLAEPGLRERLLRLYRTLGTFPEVPEALERLREMGFATAILSNGSPGMLRDAVESAGIGGLLDAVLSVDDVGTFKPDPRVYQMAVDRLGVAPGEIAFQSANAWDAHGASAFGMRVVWCNRHGQIRERLPGAPDREVRSLSELPALLKR